MKCCVQETLHVVRATSCHASAHHIECADDAGQQVIEVVRDAAREVADRLHFLRVPKSLLGVRQFDFRRPLGGDVSTGAIHISIFRNANPGNPAITAILASITIGETECRLTDLC
jgi:hypothetical protein